MANETMVSTNRAANGSGVSSEYASRLKAIREIKNSVIGNRFKKLQYLHVLPELHSLVSSSPDNELRVQALAAIGSIAYGVEEGVKAIVECNGVDNLVQALTQDDPRVVVAAARSLKLVYQVPAVSSNPFSRCSGPVTQHLDISCCSVLQSHLAPREPLLQQKALQRLISLTNQQPYAHIAEVAAQLLGLACSNEAQVRPWAAHQSSRVPIYCADRIGYLGMLPNDATCTQPQEIGLQGVSAANNKRVPHWQSPQHLSIWTIWHVSIPDSCLCLGANQCFLTSSVT
eukprot:GHUV01030827.1.p1 GENE.GHUV01030827.1~~GHUV01030827.1.p1  ORF type:complete len:286 (+),score=23.15 GHUV01030827.1:117-974(+)